MSTFSRRLSRLVLGTILASPPAFAGVPQYTVTDLGPVASFPDASSTAEAVNIHGQAAGVTNDSGDLSMTLWLPEPAYGLSAGPNALAGSRAYGVNDHGQTVGFINGEGGTLLPCMWDPFEGFSMIPSFGGTHGVAQAINNSGWVVGESDSTVPDVFRTPFLWDGTELIDLGGFDEGAFDSRAYDINELGQVVGHAQYLDNPQQPDNSHLHAALWLREPAYGLDAGIHDLDTVSVEDWQFSAARGINDLGQVVMWGSNIINHHQYYSGFWMWLPEAAYGLPAGTTAFRGPNGIESTAFAQDINNRGEIAFRANIDPSSLFGVWRAMLWHQGQWYDLIDHVPIDDQAVWSFESATDINDRGQIVGWGFRGGELRSFLLTPVIDLPCAADIDRSGDVGFSDVLALLGSWGCDDCPSKDLSGNGMVDMTDLLLLLGEWGACTEAQAGVCCFPITGDCQELLENECDFFGGYWHGGQTCETFTCSAPITGACCLYPSGMCRQFNEYNCDIAGGTWSGPFTTCGTTDCPEPPVGDTIENPFTIPLLPYSTVGVTTGFGDWYDEVCSFTAVAPDVVYAFTPDVDQVVNISLCGDSDFDTKLYVYEGDVDNAVACNDDACETPSFPYGPYVSRIDVLELSAGQTYYIVIDGYLSASGFYTLDITTANGGSCCLPDGSCVDQSQDICLQQPNAQWFGGETCATFTCPELPTGACCLTGGACVANQTEWDCEQLFGGTWAGDGVTCSEANCQ